MFRPPLYWGGRNCILNWVFFVQSILADRYVHRRELWAVSLKSPSSIKYGIEKIFSIFVFYRELSRFKIFVNIRLFLFTISVIFAKIWHNFANMIQYKLKYSTVEFFVAVRDRRALLNCLIEVFLAKIFDKSFKKQTFLIKNGTKQAFWSTLLKFARLCD